MRGAEGEGDRAAEPVWRRCLVRQGPDQALAAAGKEQWHAQPLEGGKAVHQRQIVRQALAEAQPRIDHDLLARDASVEAGGDAGVEIVEHVADHIGIAVGIVVRIVTGRRRMHQDHRATGAGSDLQAARIMFQRADIVDDMGTGGQRRLHHRGLARVDRHGDAGRGELLDHRHDAGDLIALP